MKDSLEFAWKSYEFHTAQIIKLENDLILKVSEVQKILKENYIQNKKNKILKEIIICSNKLISSYQKQSNSIGEIIEIHKYFKMHGVPIPIEREVSSSLLIELKNATKFLIEETKRQRQEISDILS